MDNSTYIPPKIDFENQPNNEQKKIESEILNDEDEEEEDEIEIKTDSSNNNHPLFQPSQNNLPQQQKIDNILKENKENEQQQQQQQQNNIENEEEKIMKRTFSDKAIKGKEANKLINKMDNNYNVVEDETVMTNYQPYKDFDNNSNSISNSNNPETEGNEITNFSNIETLETEEFGIEDNLNNDNDNNEDNEYNEYNDEDKKLFDLNNKNDDDDDDPEKKKDYFLLEKKKKEKTLPKIKEIIKRVFNSFKIGILFIIFIAFTIFFIIEPERDHKKMVAVTHNIPKYVYYDKNSPDTLAKFRTKIPVLKIHDEITQLQPQQTLKTRKNLNSHLFRSNNEERFKITYNLQKYDYSNGLWKNVQNQTHTTLVPVMKNNITIISKRSGGGSKTGPIKKDTFVFYSPYNSIPESEKNKKMLLRVEILSSYPNQVIPIEMEMIQNYIIAQFDILFGIFILFIVYILIVFELVHRTIAGMVGAFLVVAVLSILRERPSIKELVSWVEFDTIGLLFGMMVMVGIFSGTGFFEFCSLQAYKISRGKIWILTAILCTFTAVVSAFLDNVTTMLLMTPVTINLCKVINISPIPIIISEVIFSNIGGSATAIGDPPIVIIVNDAGVRANGIGFFDVALYLAPCAIIASILTFPWVRVLYWKVFSQKSVLSDEKMKKEKEIKLWSKTMRKMNAFQNEERIVRQKLKKHINQLKKQLKFIQQKTNKTDISKLEKDYKIKDWKLFLICSGVLLIVIFAFFTESFLAQWIHLSLAWIALIGAIVMLLLTNTNDMEYVMEKIEWSTLLFFGALFILMEGLDKLGLIGFVGENTSNLISSIPEKWRLAFAITLLVWVSALVSAFIDNIPYTTAMIPIVLNLAGPPVNLPLKPILWALALGCCFGGNGTLIGASANVVSAGLSESHGHPISFISFSYLGLPIMFFTILIANIYLLFIHCVLKLGLS